jgi:hypothetical protein
MLAEIDLLAGSTEQVEARARECFATYARLENDRDRAECLVVLGGAAVAQGAFPKAARFFGAAEALRKGSPVSPYELPVIERFLPELVAALGSERVDALRAEGARLDGDAERLQEIAVGGTHDP